MGQKWVKNSTEASKNTTLTIVIRKGGVFKKSLFHAGLQLFLRLRNRDRAGNGGADHGVVAHAD